MASLAPDTRRAYSSQARLYVDFCAQWSLTPFPLTATALAFYFCHFVQRGHSPVSIPAMLSALQRVSSAFFLVPLSVHDEFILKNIIPGLERLSPRVRVRKRPITLQILFRLTQMLSVHDVWEGQFLVMAFMAHDALLRFSELSVLHFSDLSFSEHDSVITLCLRMELLIIKLSTASSADHCTLIISFYIVVGLILFNYYVYQWKNYSISSC